MPAPIRPITLAASLLLAAASASAALVPNGGFESPDITGFPFLGVGSTSMPGWTVVGNTIQLTDNAAFGGLGVVASEGQQFLDLTGNIGRGGGVRSDPISTTAGQQYRLQFDLGAFFVAGQGSFGNVTVDLWVDGLAQGSFTNLMNLTAAGSDWEAETWDFTAATSSTTFEIRSSLLGSSSNLGVGLDNVRLSALGTVASPGGVPEPATPALVVIALLGLGAQRLRCGQSARTRAAQRRAPSHTAVAFTRAINSVFQATQRV